MKPVQNANDDPPGAGAFRAPMRARSLNLGQFEGASHGLGSGVVAIGEPLSGTPASLEEALLMTCSEHGDKAGRMLLRFAELLEGTHVWTQTAPEQFRLGRIVGDWFYDSSAEAQRTGMVNARPTDWSDRTFDLSLTPNAVIDAFARGGRNFQRINAE